MNEKKSSLVDEAMKISAQNRGLVEDKTQKPSIDLLHESYRQDAQKAEQDTIDGIKFSSDNKDVVQNGLVANRRNLADPDPEHMNSLEGEYIPKARVERVSKQRENGTFDAEFSNVTQEEESESVVEQLTQENEQLRAENQQLREEVRSLNENVDSLRRDIAELRELLRNQNAGNEPNNEPAPNNEPSPEGNARDAFAKRNAEYIAKQLNLKPEEGQSWLDKVQSMGKVKRYALYGAIAALTTGAVIGTGFGLAGLGVTSWLGMAVAKAGVGIGMHKYSRTMAKQIVGEDIFERAAASAAQDSMMNKYDKEKKANPDKEVELKYDASWYEKKLANFVHRGSGPEFLQRYARNRLGLMLEHGNHAEQLHRERSIRRAKWAPAVASIATTGAAGTYFHFGDLFSVAEAGSSVGGGAPSGVGEVHAVETIVPTPDAPVDEVPDVDEYPYVPFADESAVATEPVVAEEVVAEEPKTPTVEPTPVPAVFEITNPQDFTFEVSQFTGGDVPGGNIGTNWEGLKQVLASGNTTEWNGLSALQQNMVTDNLENILRGLQDTNPEILNQMSTGMTNIDMISPGDTINYSPLIEHIMNNGGRVGEYVRADAEALEYIQNFFSNLKS